MSLLGSRNLLSGRTTFQTLINDLRIELNKESKLAGLPDETIQKWMLEAEALITQETIVEEEYVLGLNTYVSKYYFQDRPNISAVSAATPMQVTATAHGLATGDRIRQQYVVGEPNANGIFLVTYVSADAFTIKRVIDITGATNDSPIRLTIADHQLADGDAITVASVLGNTAANGTRYVDVINAKEVDLYSDAGLTTEVAGNGTYAGGGTVAVNAAPAGTYVSGGQFWRDDEIPTHIVELVRATRLWSGLTRDVKIMSLDDMVGTQLWDSQGLKAYASSEYAGVIAMVERDFGRYLLTYPEPTEDANLTIYGRIRINPELYQSVSLASQLHLGFQYNELIKQYAEHKVHKWLGDDRQRANVLAEFYAKLGAFKARKFNNHRMRVSYR